MRSFSDWGFSHEPKCLTVIHACFWSSCNTICKLRYRCTCYDLAWPGARERGVADVALGWDGGASSTLLGSTDKGTAQHKAVLFKEDCNRSNFLLNLNMHVVKSSHVWLLSQAINFISSLFLSTVYFIKYITCRVSQNKRPFLKIEKYFCTTQGWYI